MSVEYNITARDAHDALEDESLVSRWDSLVKKYSHPTALYSSPAWVAHLVATDASVRVLCVTNESGQLVGVAPVQLAEHPLEFAVSTRVFTRVNLSTAKLLGSVPLIPEAQSVLERLIAAIFLDSPQCKAIYVDALPADSFVGQFLHPRVPRSTRWYTHITDGPRPWHLLALDSSFDAYLKGMSSKARANCRREARRLATLQPEGTELLRIAEPDQVTQFLDRAVHIHERSWQRKALGNRIDADKQTRESLEDLARRGILRSYLLMVGETPCAFVIGYQFAEVYYYAEIGYNEAFASHSPGKVLLFHIIDDLHQHDSPRTINFGVGDAAYKRRFGNCERTDFSCLILRKRPTYRVLTTCHSLFGKSIEFVKRMVGRRVTK